MKPIAYRPQKSRCMLTSLGSTAIMGPCLAKGISSPSKDCCSDSVSSAKGENFLEELKTVCMKRKSEMKRTEKNRVTERERER